MDANARTASRGDTTNAIVAQLDELFESIGSGVRRQRVEVAFDGLWELLGKYAKDIREHSGIQDHIFSKIVELATTGSSFEKSIRALTIVMDVNIMEPSTKRIRACEISCRLIETCATEEDCAVILGGIRQLVAESSASSSEIIARIVEVALVLFKSADVATKARALQVITSIVMNYAPQIRSMRTIVDALRQFSPSFLVRETISIPDHSFRCWSSKLLVELLRQLIFEIKSENAEALVREVETQLAGAVDGDESLLRGVLKLLVEFATWKPLSQAFSWNAKKWRGCLFETKWATMRPETQRFGILGILAITQVRIPDVHDDARVALCEFLPLCPAEASAALRQLITNFPSELSMAAAEETTRSLCRALEVLGRTPTATTSVSDLSAVVKRMLAVAGPSPNPIESLVFQCVRDLIAQRAYCVLFHFLDDVPEIMQRGPITPSHLRDWIPWTRLNQPEVEVAPPAFRTAHTDPMEGSVRRDTIAAASTEEQTSSSTEDPSADAEIDAATPQGCELPPPATLPEIEGLMGLATLVQHTTLLPKLLEYLRHDDAAIRRAASHHTIRMCEHIIAAQLAQEHVSHVAHRLDNVVSNAVEQLLDAAVADIDESNRVFIVNHLGSVFDPYLSLPDHLESLFMCKGDVSMPVKSASLILLCRLLPLHPAFVNPPLLRYQEYSIKEIEIRDSTISEALAAAVTLRICAEHRGLLPQPKQVEIVVLDRLQKLPLVSRSLVMEFLRLLKQVMDSAAPNNHADPTQIAASLAPIIAIGSTPQLRAMALDALAAMVRITPIPVDSKLFTEIYNLCGKVVLNDGEEDEPRKSATYVMSVLGAVNPVKIRSVTRGLDLNVDAAEESQQPAASNAPAPAAGNDKLIQHRPHPRSHPHMAERYPSIVLYLLINTLQTTTDPNQQKDALRCAYDTLQASPANQKTTLMSQLVPQLRRWLGEPDKANLYEFTLKIMTDLSSLLKQFKDTLPSNLGVDILKSLQAFCQQPYASQKPLNVLVVGLLDELARSLPVQDIREHRWAVEFVHQRLSRDKGDVALIVRVVKALDGFATFLHEKDMRHVVPHVLECIEVPSISSSSSATEGLSALAAARQVNNACFDFLSMITKRQPNLTKELCAQMVHATMRFIEEATEDEDRMCAISFVAGLITTVGRPAMRFIDPVQRIATRHGMPADLMRQLISSATDGTQRVKLPPAKQEEALRVDLPITLTSSVPTLSREQFEQELISLKLSTETDFEVLGVSHPGGQSVVRFVFRKHEAAEQRLQAFVRKANDQQSSLRRNLGIVSVEQHPPQEFRMSAELLSLLSALPEAKVKRKKEFTWINWNNSLCLSLLRNSPYQPFRVLGTLSPSSPWIFKEVFPFAISAALTKVDPQQRANIMSLLSQVILKAPNDIRQMLFVVAEFFESERGEKKSTVSKVNKNITCVVERDSAEQKFGINYDQDPRGNIIVTKLAPDGPGARAKVPVQGALMSINGQKVRAVSEIPAMIRGLNRISLIFTVVEEERHTPEPLALMNLQDVARAATDSENHAKALYFYEVIFGQLMNDLGEGRSRTDPKSQQLLAIVEALMKCYNRLGLSMEAKGVAKAIALKFSEGIASPEPFGFDEAGTLEQLQWWVDALKLYRIKRDQAVAMEEPVHVPSLLGMLRCYDALGDIPMMRRTVDEHWSTLDHDSKLAVAPFRAAAALALGDWELFDQAASIKPEALGSIEKWAYLFRHGSREAALKFIKDERDIRFERFCETFDDSYIRCYDVLVELQHLSNMEEQLQYRTCTDERRVMLRHLWRRRAVQISRQPQVWRSLVTINSLVLTAEEDLLTRVDAAMVCSKQGWHAFAEVLLERLMGGTPTSSQQLLGKDPNVIHAYVKHLYAVNRKTDAYRMLSEVVSSCTPNIPPSDQKAEIWGKCLCLLGEWTVQINPSDVPGAISALHRATELSPKNATAFHSLGILHYERARDPTQSAETRHFHCVSAINALIASVQLSTDTGKSSVTQDMLRILALWFANGSVPMVHEAVQTGMGSIPDQVWLRVIPQLIARIGINSVHARKLLTDLLIRVGSFYPHAFIYPLTVSERSTEVLRRRVAEQVLAGIKQSCEQLVKEASLISNELVRMAILWDEKWAAAIQAAAVKHGQLVAAKQDDQTEVLRILQPLMDELDHPSTPHERNFEKAYGMTLKRARSLLTAKAADQAWILLRQVFSNIQKQLKESKLTISEVAPTLEAMHRSLVAVPGTFDPAKPVVLINAFHQRVIVMPSKQKPRRFGLEGSDGKTYRFLLKGHEDLRQDERVMQFIDLINTIFSGDAASTSMELFIPRYAVVPLTDNVGLIGWVENTETMYRLLESRRTQYNISIYEEVNYIVSKGGLASIEAYHQQPKETRVALLSATIQNTPRDELTRIMWDKNETCEQWLEHRRLYAHTLAIMSMVGYVLGLGDRHLNNLMLQQGGAVVHIDFGDCFEVAMHRDRFSEAVPFRLTRLLINALGVTGVDGVYRLTCEHVMKLLRRHKENLLSVLEAFIYDPLIIWKLATTTTTTTTQQQQQKEETSAAGPPQPAGKEVAAATATTNLHVTTVANETAAPTTASTVAAAAMDDDRLPAVLAGAAEAPGPKLPALSCTAVRRTVVQTANQQVVEVAEDQELRNQQGHAALLRVHAKLSGQDFDGKGHTDPVTPSPTPTAAVTHAMFEKLEFFGESVKDSVVGPLASYLATAMAGTATSATAPSPTTVLEVPQQVERLIQEATSIDNLAEAFITGWAPFW